MGNHEKAIVRPADEAPWRPVTAGTATEMQVLLGAEQVPNFAMRRFIMGVGGGMPRHTNRVEHEQYVLRGRGRVCIGEAVHDVCAGTVLYMPAGVPHSYEVLEAPFEFLCLVPNKEDEIILSSS